MKFVLSSDIKPDYYMFHLDSNHKVLEMALNAVREYIIDNELLLVGGMAIDIALKENGTGIYTEYEIPDYDIVSFDNVKHANAVGSMLCKLGIMDVAILPAVHKTTMRVQISGYTVFDATYLPVHIYNNIPIVECEPFKVTHPLYQTIDQLTSLSLLWQITGPDFNIFNRLHKDAERYQLIASNYNLETKCSEVSLKKIDPPVQVVEKGKADNFNISFTWHGQLAYGFYSKLYEGNDIYRIDQYHYSDEYEFLIQSPPAEYDTFIKGYSAISPDCYVKGDCRYYVLTDFTVNFIEGQYVVSPYYVAGYCLYMNYHSKNPIWNMMYHGMLKMLETSIGDLSLLSVGLEYWKDEFYTKNYESMMIKKKSLDGIPPKNYLSTPNCEIKKTFDPELSEYYALHLGQ